MNKLLQLHKMLEEAYQQYKLGNITEKEYLVRVKPIDKVIDKLEMSTLQDIPVLKESSLLHFHKQEN